MTARELIAALSELPPDIQLAVWIDGERHQIDPSTPIDPWGDFHADINTTTEPAKD